MRCKNCDYRLWNLPGRVCPECGTPFLPSEHEFIPNSVRFCCPHCGQAYYGTGPQGHLVPVEFNCSSCGRLVHMNDMVLQPTEGVQEEQTRVHRLPWLERAERGWVRAWLSTVGMALTSPYRLMRGLPVEGSHGAAWFFAILTACVTGLSSVLAVMVFVVVVMVPQGGVGPAELGGALAGLGIGGVMLATGAIVTLAVWGLLAHGLLRLTGRTYGTIGRTYQALCYSAGASVVSGIPLCGWYFGWIWWLISGVLCVKEAQKVHGGRAAFAVLTPPVLVLGVFIGLYVFMLVSMFRGTGPFGGTGMPTAFTIGETQQVVSAVTTYASRHAGRPPEHAIQLVTGGFLNPNQLVSSGTDTLEGNVPISAELTLADFADLTAGERRELEQDATEALDDGTIAHRLGDYVFVYHGIDCNKANPGLWLVVMCADPDANPTPGPNAPMAAGCADGSVRVLNASTLAADLQAQNKLRAGRGLPPLPDPRTVRHGQPAVAGPQDDVMPDEDKQEDPLLSLKRLSRSGWAVYRDEWRCLRR